MVDEKHGREHSSSQEDGAGITTRLKELVAVLAIALPFDLLPFTRDYKRSDRKIARQCLSGRRVFISFI